MHPVHCKSNLSGERRDTGTFIRSILSKYRGRVPAPSLAYHRTSAAPAASSSLRSNIVGVAKDWDISAFFAHTSKAREGQCAFEVLWTEVATTASYNLHSIKWLDYKEKDWSLLSEFHKQAHCLRRTHSWYKYHKVRVSKRHVTLSVFDTNKYSKIIINSSGGINAAADVWCCTLRLPRVLERRFVKKNQRKCRVCAPY